MTGARVFRQGIPEFDGTPEMQRAAIQRHTDRLEANAKESAQAAIRLVRNLKIRAQSASFPFGVQNPGLSRIDAVMLGSLFDVEAPTTSFSTAPFLSWRTSNDNGIIVQNISNLTSDRLYNFTLVCVGAL